MPDRPIQAGTETAVITRRTLIASSLLPAAAQAQSAPTKFTMACMTLPYAAFPLERGLTGIKTAGYDQVAWGVTHREASGMKPVIAVDAPASEAARLAARCRGMGLEPVMMFSTVNLEAPNALDAHLRRIDQAAAARIPFLLTFGKTSPGEYDTFVGNLKKMAPHAKKSGVMVVIKQHGGNTATGADCARIVNEVAHESVKICYDAGNVLDYESHDPIKDILTCVRDIRAFNIKDHRDTPKDQDCGPGFGEIDHYKLFMPVMRTGLTIPLTFENIFEPLLPRPSAPEGVDALARRAREYIETVIRGLQTI
jgi:sugar phosphate isomerase/epimerase